MAGPHVVGVVALLWSARPSLVRDMPRTKYLLTRSANPSVTVAEQRGRLRRHRARGPNNHFGWGRVDALAAYNLEPSLHQTITFPAIADKTFGDAGLRPGRDRELGPAGQLRRRAATARSAGGTVHITGAGSCTVTASQAGLDAYDIAAGAPVPYYAAPDVSRTFAIAKASQTIDFGAARRTRRSASTTGTSTSRRRRPPGCRSRSPRPGPCTVSGVTVDITASATARSRRRRPGTRTTTRPRA